MNTDLSWAPGFLTSWISLSIFDFEHEESQRRGGEGGEKKQRRNSSYSLVFSLDVRNKTWGIEKKLTPEPRSPCFLRSSLRPLNRSTLPSYSSQILVFSLPFFQCYNVPSFIQLSLPWLVFFPSLPLFSTSSSSLRQVDFLLFKMKKWNVVCFCWWW